MTKAKLTRKFRRPVHSLLRTAPRPWQEFVNQLEISYAIKYGKELRHANNAEWKIWQGYMNNTMITQYYNSRIVYNYDGKFIGADFTDSGFAKFLLEYSK